jgi:hypothetical protein
VNMENDRYTVFLQYDPNHIEIHEKVLACLSRLDRGAAERIGKTKLTGRLIVKRSTDLETAKRLKHKLQDCGALCSVQRLPCTLPPANGKDRQTAGRLLESQRETNPLLIRCPNCGYEQPPVSECRACRIIISKSRARREPGLIERPAADKRLPQQPARTQFLNTVRRHTRSLVALLSKFQHPIGVQKLTSWGQRVADRLIRCAIVFILVLILQIGLLSLGKMLWFLYVSTAAGQYYLEKLPEKAEMFQRIVHADALLLGWDTTLTVLLVGLLLGCAAQVLHLIRYLYESQGIIGKLALWVIPSMGLTAWIVSQRHPYPEYALAATLVALPTLCLLSSCLYLAQITLPELGDFRKIIAIIVKNKGKTWGDIIKKIRIWLDTTKQVY